MNASESYETTAIFRLSKSLFPLSPSGREFAVLTAYYDESGTHDGSPVTVLAGLIGDADACAHFELEWQKVLRGFKVSHYHTKELRHRQGPYKGWSPDRADLFRNALIYVVQQHKRVFVTRTVLCNRLYDEFYKTPKQARRERLDTKYAMCVRSCLHFIARGAFEGRETETVNFLMEDGHRNAADAMRVWREVRNDKTIEWRGAVGALAFDGKKSHALLQAANMMAYEIFQAEIDVMREEGSEYRVNSIATIEDELVRSGLVVADHQITLSDLVQMRENHRSRTSNENLFHDTVAVFDELRHFGWNDPRESKVEVAYMSPLLYWQMRRDKEHEERHFGHYRP